MSSYLVIDDVEVWRKDAAPVPTPVPVPPVEPPPFPPPGPPIPPAPSPGDGWSQMMSPFTSELVIGGSGSMTFDINTWLTFRFHVGANQVHVHPIRFDSGHYKGAMGVLQVAVTAVDVGAFDFWISATPNGAPVSPYARGMNQGLAAVLSFYFAPTMGAWVPQKDRQYYLNVKSSQRDTPVGYLLNATAL